MPTSREEHELRVRSYEIDAYRHVNNAAYVSWLEDARERFLRAEDRDYAYYPEQQGAFIVVVNIDIDYLAAAKADDRIALRTRLVAIGRSSVTFRHVVRAAEEGEVFARARVVMAFGDGQGNAVAVPEDFRRRFAPCPDGDRWLEDEERAKP